MVLVIAPRRAFYDCVVGGSAVVSRRVVIRTVADRDIVVDDGGFVVLTVVDRVFVDEEVDALFFFFGECLVVKTVVQPSTHLAVPPTVGGRFFRHAVRDVIVCTSVGDFLHVFGGKPDVRVQIFLGHQFDGVRVGVVDHHLPFDGLHFEVVGRADDGLSAVVEGDVVGVRRFRVKLGVGRGHLDELIFAGGIETVFVGRRAHRREFLVGRFALRITAEPDRVALPRIGRFALGADGHGQESPQNGENKTDDENDDGRYGCCFQRFSFHNAPLIALSFRV